jgi:hypothetical protein
MAKVVMEHALKALSYRAHASPAHGAIRMSVLSGPSVRVMRTSSSGRSGQPLLAIRSRLWDYRLEALVDQELQALARIAEVLLCNLYVLHESLAF